MVPLRFFLGTVMLWVLLAFFMNGLNGLAMTSGVQNMLSPDTGMSGVSTTYSTDSSGAPAQYQAVTSTGISQFTQWAFFDYPALFNDENGNPDELRSAIRYALLVVIGIGFLIALAYTLKQIFT